MARTEAKRHKAYRLIKQAIISGELRPGEIFSVTELCEKFSLSKTPTREALIVLGSEDLVESIPRSGYMITRVSVSDMLELFHLRTLLEVEAIGLAIDRITEDDIRALKENNLQEKKVLDGNQHKSAETPTYRRGYELNSEFHLIIARASGSSRLAALIERLIDDMERILALDPSIAQPEQHVAIIDALENRDRAAAKAAIAEHLEETKLHLIDRL